MKPTTTLKTIAFTGLAALCLTAFSGCASQEEPQNQPKVFMSVPAYYNGNASIASGDVTGDGFPDLVIAAEKKKEYEAAIYVAEGSGTPGAYAPPALITSIPLYTQGGLGVTLADTDGDGDLDILAAAERVKGKEAEVFLIENRIGKGYLPPISSLSLGTVPYYSKGGLSITTQDVNKDGRSDIIVCAASIPDSKVNVYILQNRGFNTFDLLK